MIVCLCKGVSDRAIKECIADGATSVRQIGRCTGAGTDCGTCGCDLRRLVREAGCTHDEAPANSRELVAALV